MRTYIPPSKAFMIVVFPALTTPIKGIAIIHFVILSRRDRILSLAMMVPDG